MIKPAIELAIRERCMWQITPEQIADLPPSVSATGRAYSDAMLAYEEAWQAREDVRIALISKMQATGEQNSPESWPVPGPDRALSEATRICTKAWQAYDETEQSAREAALFYRAELEAWHAKHCPALRTPEGCPWDGTRLVGVGE
jgi:hypothetical protein